MEAVRVIRAGRAYPDADSDPIVDAGILIEDDAIVSVAPFESLPVPAESTVELTDATAWTALPGLIDMHLHVTTEGAGRLHEEMSKPFDKAVAQGRANLENAMRWGATTVRDAGSWNEAVLVLERLARESLTCARVLPCGAPLTTPDGHLWWFGGGRTGEAELRAFVHGQADLGMTHIKVMATGGWATPGSDPRLPQFSVAELRAIVDEAHDAGLTTMAHLASTEGVRRSVEASIDTLEHSMFQRPDGVWEYPQDLIARIVESGSWVDPTPAWHYRTVESPPPGASEARIGELRQARAARMEAYRRLLEAGQTRWLVGSDTGGTNPQDTFPLACQIMVEEIGLTPRDVVRAATTSAALAAGLANVGALRPGMSADVALFESDPMEDIRSVFSLRQVFARGRKREIEPSADTRAASHGGGWE